MPHLLARFHDIDMVPRGLEPRTLWLLAIRSNQLSYETMYQHRKNTARCLVLGVPDEVLALRARTQTYTSRSKLLIGGIALGVESRRRSRAANKRLQ